MMAALEIIGADPSPINLQASFVRALRITLVANFLSTWKRFECIFHPNDPVMQELLLSPLWT